MINSIDNLSSFGQLLIDGHNRKTGKEHQYIHQEGKSNYSLGSKKKLVSNPAFDSYIKRKQSRCEDDPLDYEPAFYHDHCMSLSKLLKRFDALSRESSHCNDRPLEAINLLRERIRQKYYTGMIGRLRSTMQGIFPCMTFEKSAISQKIEKIADRIQSISSKAEKLDSHIVKSHGYKCLTHCTQKEKVLSILKSGYLFTGDKVPYPPTGCGLGANRSEELFFDISKKRESPDSIQFHSIYTYGTLENGGEFGDLEAITLIFQLSVLDNTKFHISSSGWKYGAFDIASDYRYNMPKDRLISLMQQDTCGEVVLYESVSIDHLIGIWVHPTKKIQAIDYFKQNHITSVNNILIEDFLNATSQVWDPVI